MTAALIVVTFSFLLGAAYIALGIVQMVAPKLAIRVYRPFVGAQKFAEIAQRWAHAGRWWNRVVGGFYILFGCAIVWAAMGTARNLTHGPK